MRFLSVMVLYQYHVFKQEILYFTIKEQDATCRSYFLIIGYLLYSEYLSQLYILNVMNSNKYLDLQKGRIKSFGELKRWKEVTPEKLQQLKYPNTSWLFSADCDLKYLYKHLNKLNVEHRKTDARAIFTCSGKKKIILLVNSLLFVL